MLDPVHIMARDFQRALQYSKLNRDNYSAWKANEEAAKKRAEEFRKCRKQN